MNKKSEMHRAEQGRLEKRSFLTTLVLVSVLFLILLKPFWGAIFWACIIGLIFSPLYRRLLAAGRPKPNVAALTTLLACLVIGIVPALFVIGSFIQEGVSFYRRLQSGDFDIGARIEQIQTAFPAIRHFFERLNLDFNSVQTQLSDAFLGASGYLAQNAIEFGQGTLQFFINLGLMLYVAFFMLRDGEKLVGLLVRALPLGDEREHLLIAKFAEVVRATVKGNLLVATVQGMLGGFIFWVLDIRGALLWGVVMTLLSLIPVVGAGLIWGPVAIYLFAVGAWPQGLILAAFGAFVIGLADNILRPLLVGRDTKLPDYVVLLSTLGGFALFGINGFVLGPLVAALFIAFWEIFMREFNRPQSGTSKEDAP
ncbi:MULTISPECIES: AI-2E family transporter [Syntrophotalea]|uniref:AI-2E family transporter n=1 Tax=Syntrophotalea acetylenica TaxID=29542 RepID=A0A1L3GJ45_SYNAC|nr:AI-2E family transporter [Syntrophotalea acetylenica]APG25931.1 AI-2E family transporter [Syntrophotalea acetylenica]APG44001.1 AI-2E family transporter [Syntrophotalea acetylenica]